MSKTDFISQINVTQLAKALSQNAKAGKEGVFRHKGFLDLIAQSQGFSNFKAMQACVPAQGVASSAPALQTLKLYQRIDGNWAEPVSVRFNPQTMRVEPVEQDRLMAAFLKEGPRAEYLQQGSQFYHVVRNPQTGWIAYALRSFADFEKAAGAQLDLLQSHSVFEINGLLTRYGLNGDWATHAEQAFENCDFVNEFGDETQEYGSLDLNQALQSECPAWFAECRDEDGSLYEFFFSALDLLFLEPCEERSLFCPHQKATIVCLR